MKTLFPITPGFPQGFSNFEEFISEVEEQNLLEAISKIPVHPLLFQGYEAKRKVASFGYDWNFEKQALSKGKKIPEVFATLIQKVADHLSVPKNDFAELLITEYPVGSVINWHRDAPPFDIIAGISLLCDCNFRLRPYDKTKQKRNAVVSFPVKQRSLYIMQSIARSEWEHSITAVKQIRYSITLRTLRSREI